MLTPKKNGPEEDFFNDVSPHPHSEPAGVRSRKPLSQILREAREHKNMSLQEVAKLTHIPLNYLQLLEGEGDQRAVPDSLYLIASLRSYVDFLDIEAGGALTQFIAELETGSPMKEKAGRGGRPPQFFNYFPQQWSRPFPWIILLMLTLGLLAVVGYYSELSQGPRPTEETIASFPPPAAPSPAPQSGTLPPASSSTPPVSPSTADLQEPSSPSPAVSPPLAAAPQAEPSAAPAPRLKAPGVNSSLPAQTSPSSASHHLRVQAKAKTWLHVTIDDQPLKRLFLSPGQSLEWSAEKEFTLSLGNAGAVKLSLDGKELPPLGKAGQMALNVRLPSQRGSQEREVRKAERPRVTKPR